MISAAFSGFCYLTLSRHLVCDNSDLHVLQRKSNKLEDDSNLVFFCSISVSFIFQYILILKIHFNMRINAWCVYMPGFYLSIPPTWDKTKCEIFAEFLFSRR